MSVSRNLKIENLRITESIFLVFVGDSRGYEGLLIRLNADVEAREAKMVLDGLQ